MSSEPQLFRVNPKSRESERIEEVDFGRLGFLERPHIQEWVAANPGILGEDLLIVGKEFSGFDLTNERPDLLAVDSDGRLVIIELKRDDTGTDAHWQAIKYASYFQRADADAIIGMLVNYSSVSRDEAESHLLESLDTDDPRILNNDQRIILVSHRFAPEVTTAALWLNEQVGKNLITCVKLTPHRDGNTDSLYIQSATIIPVPGVDVIGIGESIVTKSSSRKEALEQANNDGSIVFIEKVRTLALRGLSEDIRPDKIGGVRVRTRLRQSNLWYVDRPPWHRLRLYYSIRLRPAQETKKWQAEVRLFHERQVPDLEGLQSIHERPVTHGSKVLRIEIGPDILDDKFADRVAEKLGSFITQITPIVDALEEESEDLEDETDGTEG